MAHIGVSVNDETKDEWENYIEQTDYGSMSELIRASVRKEIQQEGGDSGIPRELEKELNGVAETQNTLQDQMAELVNEFENVSDVMTESQYSEEIIELAHDLAEDIEEKHPDEFSSLAQDAEMGYAKLAREHLGDESEAYKIPQAFQYLEENLSYIKCTPRGPNDYYRVRR